MEASERTQKIEDKMREEIEDKMREEMAHLIKEAVLANERHRDLASIEKTLVKASDIIKEAVKSIATTLVTRLILTIGGIAAWFTFFMMGMRDDTVELKRSNAETQEQIRRIATDLKETTYMSQQNASAIREIIIKMGLDSPEKHK